MLHVAVGRQSHPHMHPGITAHRSQWPVSGRLRTRNPGEISKKKRTSDSSGGDVNYHGRLFLRVAPASWDTSVCMEAWLEFKWLLRVKGHVEVVLTNFCLCKHMPPSPGAPWPSGSQCLLKEPALGVGKCCRLVDTFCNYNQEPRPEGI